MSIRAGGRLPFTWPTSTGDVPVASTVRQFVPEDTTRFGVAHGGSYTDLTAEAPEVDPSPVGPGQTNSVKRERVHRRKHERLAR